MSRVGRLPIPVPDSVEVAIDGTLVRVKGPKGELSRNIHPEMAVDFSDGDVTVSRPSDSKTHRSLHGLSRSLINNMVVGVTRGFEKKLEIVGVGYRAELRGKRLVLNLGYSHPIVFVSPEDINVAVEGNNKIVVQGNDKELVGRVAAKIRSFRPPEPYKGKGIKYEGEHIKRKAGKTAA